MRQRLDDARALLATLAGDFAPRQLRTARFIDEIACLLSVLLAIAVARLIGVGNVGWAAASAYIVIRASFADSLRRGSLRVLGTAAGVCLAWLLAPQLLRSTALLSIALALFGAATLYLALLGRYGYGWLLCGLSFAMVLVDGMEQAHAAIGDLARARLLEVAVGTGVSILVSALSALALRRQRPAAPDDAAPAPAARLWHKAAFVHALQGALALGLIPWVWAAFHIQALSQGSITIMAVMMVPAAELAAPRHPASAKLRHRFIGCGIGGLLATGVLLLSHDAPALMTLAVCVGVVIGRHIENSRPDICYVGTQFALAFLVVLVPDCYAGLHIEPGLERLSGIVLGMALLEPLRLLFRRFA